MPFRIGRDAPSDTGMSALTVTLWLTLKPQRPVQNRHMHEARRGDQNERSRFTPTLRAVALINAQASSESGTPL